MDDQLSFFLHAGHSRFKFQDEGLKTVSSDDQTQVEENVERSFSSYGPSLELDPTFPSLNRAKHILFLKKGLQSLSESYACLDASRPWLCYWILHCLELLQEPLNEDVKSKVAQFLSRCQHPLGGFCGGPGQLPHLAPTYAAVNALCILGTDEALKVINRKKLAEFITRMRDPVSGGFKLEETGETDVRGAYCAASVAHLTQTITKPMFEGTAEWVLSCQTYEGGFAGCPGMEAHGGYAFCAFAALVIFGKEKLCDLPNFMKWIANRQMRFEGGFQGRTNKMVDGCYSFWQGGAFPLIHATLTMQNDAALDSCWLFHQPALQEYLLLCCQHVFGGLVDKPGKQRDYYHSCYCLSGLSVAQNGMGCKCVVGDTSNHLPCTHPLYNICFRGAQKALAFFERERIISENGSYD